MEPGLLKQPEEDALVLQQNKSSCSWPGLYYDKIQAILSLTNPRLVVEVGVAYGYHAVHILENNSDTEYVGVDPFLAGYDADDPFVKDVSKLFNSDPQQAMDRLHSAVEWSLSVNFPERSRLERVSSLEASDFFEDEQVDAVFIDGDHRYKGVKADLFAWWPKVTKGGLLLGDDLNWPDVRRAVEKFAKKSGAPYVVLQNPDLKHASFMFVKR